MASESFKSAVQNNNRLFPPFARKLAQNDTAVYTTFADKLAVWLSSERAYYPAARQEIVKLLLTAHATLRRAVGADANSNIPFHISTCIGHAMTAPYARLLKAVHPHRELFVEPELRDQIRRLLSTIYMPSAIPADETLLPAGISSESSLNSHTPPMQFSSSSLSSALRIPSPVSLPGPLSQAPVVASNTIASQSSVPSSDFSDPPEISIPTRLPQPAQTLHPISSTGARMQKRPTLLHNHNTASPSFTHSGENNITKKKKKVKLELAALVAKDIEELNRKRAVKQEPVEDSLSGYGGVLVSSSLSCGEDSIDTSPVPLVDIRSSGIETMNATGGTNVGSSSVIEIASEHADNHLLEAGYSGISISDTRHSEHSSTEMPDLTSSSTNVSLSGLDASGATEYPQTQHFGEQTSRSNLGTSPANDVEMADDTILGLNDSDHTAILASSIPGGKDAHDVTYDGSNMDDDMSVDVSVSANCHGASVGTGDKLPAQDPVPDADGQTTEDIEPDATGLDSEIMVPDTSGPSEVTIGLLRSCVDTGHDPKASFLVQTGRIVDDGTTKADISAHLSPCADNSMEAITPAADPDATLMRMQDALVSSLDIISERNTPTSTAWPALQASSLGPTVFPPNSVPDVFGGKMCILAIRRGLSNNNKLTLRFDIHEEQLQALSVWNNRRNNNEGLQESLCMSLACYAWKKGGRKTVDQLSALPACWPKVGGLTMGVLYKGRREEFPLSPPFMVAPNGWVDVSEFLSLGSNVIELNHRLDMSGYIFILRVHSPTQGQLEEVAQRYRKKQDWQEWLQHVSRPLDIPLPPFS